MDIMADVHWKRVLVMSEAELHGIVVADGSQVWKALPLGRRIAWKDFVPLEPPQSAVNRWRRDSGINAVRLPNQVAARGAPDNATRKLLALPAKRGPPDDDAPEAPPRGARAGDLDPIERVDAISFSLKLRAVQEFSAAIQDADRYNRDDYEEPPPREGIDPVRSHIERMKVHLDAVGMALERRIWAPQRAGDSVIAINCYSDSSPVVGAEIQGMICDVMLTNNRMRRVTLPPSTVHYAHADMINKAMCFVWGYGWSSDLIWRVLLLFLTMSLVLQLTSESKLASLLYQTFCTRFVMVMVEDCFVTRCASWDGATVAGTSCTS